jgi:hypothetical protein
MTMPDREQIIETQLHTLKGEYPTVDTYPHVNTELLYEGDDAPFHVTLPILEVGRVSLNGLLYDEELVSSIETQLQKGADGIGGHISDDKLATSYPVAEVYWIGHKREGNVTWAKGYIPPSERRNDIRRKKANNGTVGTSIFGNAVREAATVPGKKAYRAKDFELDTLDLAPGKRASLRMNRGFTITKEMENSDQEEAIMPELDKKQVISELTVGEIPTHLREQIIQEAKVQADAARVSELTSRISELENEVKEMADYKSIVAEIRGTIGKDTDTVQIVTEYHNMATKLAEILGMPHTSIAIRVEEMHMQMAEMTKVKFESEVDAKVAELTNWQVVSPDNQARVAEFRKTVRKAIVREMGGKHEKLAEVVQQVWESDFKGLAELMVSTLGGPSAIIGGQQRQTAATSWESLKTPEGIKALREKAGWSN